MYDGLYNNMKRHIRCLQPKVYQEEIKLTVITGSSDQDDVTEYVLEYIEINNLDIKSIDDYSVKEHS